MACATFGLVLGGLIGGPVALSGQAPSTPEGTRKTACAERLREAGKRPPDHLAGDDRNHRHDRHLSKLGS